MATTTTDALFDAGFLSRLESLSLLARQIQRGRQRAERRSTRRGASVEFAEYRQFVNGDDWRFIDWNAFARWRQLVVKLFHEEEDLHVHILLDCSLSMDWGDPVKFDYARKVAAGFAYISLAGLDRISITPLTRGAQPRWPSMRGKHRFLQILRFLADCKPYSQPQSLEEVVRHWLASQPRRGIVILISDLWGINAEDSLKALDRLRYSRQQVGVVQVRSPDEAQPQDLGEIELEDCESGQLRRMVISPQVAKMYRENFLRFHRHMEEYTRRYQISMVHADTAFDVCDLLQRALFAGGFVK